MAMNMFPTAAVIVLVVLVIMTMTMTVFVAMIVAVTILECDGFRELLVSKVCKSSILKHLLDLVLGKPMMCYTTQSGILGVYLVGNKVNDEEDTAWVEALGQLLGC
jgi:hypothetical protein